jgi:hypothetical protein
MKFTSTLSISLLLFTLLALSAHPDEKRIYQTDSLGNIQYNKPSYTIQKDGRIIQTDPTGNKQYDKQQYQIKGDKTYPVDSLGNIQYNKPQFETK